MWDFVRNNWKSGLEIAVLSVAVYFMLRFIRGTRGARVLTGLVLLLLVLTLVSQMFELETISWLLGHFFAIIVVALVVIFQPELRRALAEVGSQPIFFTISNEREVVDTIVKVAVSFSARKIGTLMAFEREISLRGVGEAGAVIDARLSQELLEQIFFPNSPLHDGGAIIQNNRLYAAACIFPLTQRTDLSKSMGTRHRAALGLAEETDAVVVVVSEETGIISVACHGELYQNLDRESLRDRLTGMLVGIPKASWLGKLQSSLKEPEAEKVAS